MGYYQQMRIGELADETGTTVQALRFYEREGLLRQPPRTASGYRAYSAADVDQVRFVKNCQQLGFSLKEIKELATIHGTAPKPPRRMEFLRIARERLAFLDAKIAEYQGLRRQVAGLLCQAERTPLDACPARPVLPPKISA